MVDFFFFLFPPNFGVFLVFHHPFQDVQRKQGARDLATDTCDVVVNSQAYLSPSSVVFWVHCSSKTRQQNTSRLVPKATFWERVFCGVPSAVALNQGSALDYMMYLIIPVCFFLLTQMT